MAEYWTDKQYAFFCHSQCEYFPCHPTKRPEDFNCLFCYCPLYCLGDTCGGAFVYTKNGIKDCSACGIPHQRENYGYITEKFQAIVQNMKQHSNTGE